MNLIKKKKKIFHNCQITILLTLYWSVKTHVLSTIHSTMTSTKSSKVPKEFKHHIVLIFYKKEYTFHYKQSTTANRVVKSLRELTDVEELDEGWCYALQDDEGVAWLGFDKSHNGKKFTLVSVRETRNDDSDDSLYEY